MISLQSRREPSGVTIGKSLGDTTVWMRNSGGAPTMMWTSDALAATAFRRMSFRRLIVFCPLSVARCQSPVLHTHPRREALRRTTDDGPLFRLRRVLGHAEDFVDRRQPAADL